MLDVSDHLEAISLLCQRFHVKRLELFGSRARGDATSSESDFDFLVEFEDRGWNGSSDHYFGLLFGLEDLLRAKVDLVELKAVTNPFFLELASRDRKQLYAA